MEIKNLLTFKGDLDLIKSELMEKNYDIAWGEYSIPEIRKAIMTEQPAFLEISGQPVLAIGENEDSIIFNHNNKIYEMLDNELENQYSGNAVIVQRHNDYEGDLIIFTPERDTWLPEWEEQKQKAINILKKLTIGKCYLPSHPIIITFKKPSEFEIKNVIRAMAKGVEITIYDPSDPVSEILHELGHIFWNNKLTEKERQSFFDYKKSYKKNDEIPSIYTSEYYFKTGEEIFATIYMYYVKAKVINPGYLEILEQKEKQGFSLFKSIIDRLIEESFIKENWSKNELILKQFLKGKRYKIKGQNKIIKTEINLDKNIFFDRAIDHTVLYKGQDREWIRIEEGCLKGEAIVLKDEIADLNFMKTVKSVLHSLPEEPGEEHQEEKLSFKERLLKAINQATLIEKAYNIATYAMLREKAKEINTNPTEKQKEAGNYKKASFNWNGLKITIENPKGSHRSGVSEDGKEWKSKMHHDYGYVNRTEGNDGDHVDVFIGKDLDTSDTVFVVNQVNPKTGEFDEHKCMLGFKTMEDAKKGYLKNYEKGWQGIGSIKPLSIISFKDWLNSSEVKKKILKAKGHKYYKKISVPGGKDLYFYNKKSYQKHLKNQNKRLLKNINQFVKNAIKDRENKHKIIVLGEVDSEIVKEAQKHGLDVHGYKHVIDTSSVRHILNEHGVGKEKDKKQIPVTEKDFEKIPEIIETYDELEFGTTTNRGTNAVTYIKVYDKRVYYVEEIRTGRKQLAAFTMYIKGK